MTFTIITVEVDYVMRILLAVDDIHDSLKVHVVCDTDFSCRSHSSIRQDWSGSIRVTSCHATVVTPKYRTVARAVAIGFERQHPFNTEQKRASVGGGRRVRTLS